MASHDHAALARRLLGADGPEISCEECFAQIDRYVDVEQHDGRAAADRTIPGMRAHLDGCRACDEEYASLRALLCDDAAR